MSSVRTLTHGSPIATLQAGDYTLTEVRYGPGDSYAPHSHDRSYLLLVLEGGFREEAERESHDATSGTVVMMPSGCRHHNRIGPAGARGLLVTLDGRASASIGRFRRFHRGDVSRAMLQLYRAYRGDDAVSIEEHLFEVTSTKERGSECVDRRCVRIALELLSDASDQQLSLAGVAARAGVTPAYLARAFRHSVGRTMGQYLRGVRARKAAEILTSSAVPLAEAALMAGFADQSHLCRVLKAEFGLTPGQYRRLVKFVQDH